MDMRSFDLTPLFRSTIGFDRFSNLIDSALKGEDNIPSYPPYNIEKLSDDEYRIVLAVAGFKEQDLTLTVQENQLTVAGNHTGKAEGSEANYLYKGIATRTFERKFNLADHVKVTAADLADGLLTVALKRELPESVKPRMVPINSNGNSKIGAVIDGRQAN
jgi:molecular chaperone IbpA